MLDEKASKIFASTYQLHLPSEKELEAELKRELKQLKHDLKETKKTIRVHIVKGRDGC